MQKSGVSDVVATVIIIALTIVAITVVWLGVMPLIRDKIGGSDVCNDVDVSIESSQGYTCWASDQNLTLVQLKKGSSDANVSKVKFAISSSGNSVSYSNVTNFQRNSFEVFYLNTTGFAGIDKVEVVPFVKSGKSEKACSAVFVENLKSCGPTALSPTEVAQIISSGSVSNPDTTSVNGNTEQTFNPPKQAYAPVLNVISPINNSVSLGSTVWLNVSSDQVVNWFYFNGSVNISFSPNISVSNLNNGNYNWIIYANNSNGINSTSLNFSVNVPCATQNGQGFFNGAGTVSDPYGICNCTMLQNMKNYLTSNFSLLSNISCNSFSGFVPIGDCGADGSCILNTDNHPFVGNFNGNNFSIIGLTINSPATNGVGLFACSANGSISNLRIIDANMNGGTCVGVLAGHTSFGDISNVYSIGRLAGVKYAGGLVGLQSAGSILNSYSNVTVACSDVSGYAGGIAGYSSGNINSSYAIGNVTSISASGTIVGGAIGYKSAGFIFNSYAMGNVTGSSQVGGLIGYMNTNGIALNSYSTGKVVTTTYGGLIGYKFGIGATITSSFWDRETSGQALSFGGISKLTADMKNPVTFTNAGWSTDVWNLTAGYYPSLKWQNL